MAEKYFCITCEQAGVADSLVELTQQGCCPTCGGSLVVSASKFAAVAGEVLQAQQAATQPTKVRASVATTVEDARRKRIDSLCEAYKPVRRFLGRNKFVEIDLWWDGFSLTVDYSCQPNEQADEPTEGQQEWLSIQLKNSDGSRKELRFYFDPEDESLREVKP